MKSLRPLREEELNLMQEREQDEIRILRKAWKKILNSMIWLLFFLLALYLFDYKKDLWFFGAVCLLIIAPDIWKACTLTLQAGKTKEDHALLRRRNELEETVVNTSGYVFSWKKILSRMSMLLFFLLALYLFDYKKDSWFFGAVYLLIIAPDIWEACTLALQAGKTKKKHALLRRRNEVQEMAVNTSGYIFFPRNWHNGDHGFLFQLEDNKVLAMSGKDVRPDKNWPSGSFRIVRARDGDGLPFLFTIFNEGMKMEPVLTVKNLGSGFHKKYPAMPDPKRFTIADGTLEAYMKIMREP